MFTSCKKEDDVSVSRALVDDWTLTKIGLDDNGNGLLDTAERNSLFAIGYDAVTVTFQDNKTGISKALYYPTIFGYGDFHWDSDDRNQSITISNSDGATATTKLIFIDFNTIAVLDKTLDIYGKGLWNVYSRK
jgi:hypothetical protein